MSRSEAAESIIAAAIAELRAQGERPHSAEQGIAAMTSTDLRMLSTMIDAIRFISESNGVGMKLPQRIIVESAQAAMQPIIRYRRSVEKGNAEED
jgi:hypothetical protein